ncbi:MAG: hypothetical protein ACOX2F_00940 [bacterium]
MKKFACYLILALFAFAMLSIASCGDDSGKQEENDKQLADNEGNESPDENAEEEEEEEEEVELDYPEEVSATCNSMGDIARNLPFFDSDDKARTLAEWYKPNNKSSNIIWLIFSTYDCPACKFEKVDIPSLNGKYAKRGLKTILIMNGLLTGPQPNNEPDKVAEMKEGMISMEGDDADFVFGYLGSSQQAEFRKFISQGYPVNVFIDAKTMEIIKHFEGWDNNESFYTSMDRFIDIALDMY